MQARSIIARWRKKQPLKREKKVMLPHSQKGKEKDLCPNQKLILHLNEALAIENVDRTKIPVTN